MSLKSSKDRPALQSKRQQKYPEIVSHLEQQIATGLLGPGDRLPSFAELRESFGATPGTVSRAFSELELRGLVVRERGRGIFVGTSETEGARRPRELSTNSLGIIGVATDASIRSHPYYVRLLQGVQDQSHSMAREVLLQHEDSKIQWEKMGGLLVIGIGDAAAIKRRPPGMPCVSVMFAVDGVDGVVADDYRGAWLATQHLIDLGHKRIGFLAAHDPVTEIRIQGYMDCLCANDLPFNRKWLRSLVKGLPVSRESIIEVAGRETMKAWLSDDWHQLGCTALLAQNDDAAISVIEVLQDAGCKVPEQVSVVGFDGSQIAEYFRPRLTTIEVPLRRIGALGAQRLISLIDQPLGSLPDSMQEHAPQVIVEPVQLKVGASTARPPV